METFSIIIFCLSVTTAVAALFASAISDFRTMTIPNRYPAAIAVAFVIAFGVSFGFDAGGPLFSHFYLHSMGLALMLGLTFIMFAVGVWGAGDSKLASGIALWIGLKGFPGFLMVMALTGLALVLTGLILRRLPDRIIARDAEGTWPQRMKAGKAVLPYGIAIAAGGLATFIDQGLLNFFQIAAGP